MDPRNPNSTLMRVRLDTKAQIKQLAQTYRLSMTEAMALVTESFEKLPKAEQRKFIEGRAA